MGLLEQIRWTAPSSGNEIISGPSDISSPKSRTWWTGARRAALRLIPHHGTLQRGLPFPPEELCDRKRAAGGLA